MNIEILNIGAAVAPLAEWAANSYECEREWVNERPMQSAVGYHEGAVKCSISAVNSTFPVACLLHKQSYSTEHLFFLEGGGALNSHPDLSSLFSSP